jgi:hypothetical protein
MRINSLAAHTIARQRLFISNSCEKYYGYAGIQGRQPLDAKIFFQ